MLNAILGDLQNLSVIFTILQALLIFDLIGVLSFRLLLLNLNIFRPTMITKPIFVVICFQAII